MRLTTFTDFGLRALMRIAGEPERSLSSTVLADELEIPRSHLAKILSALASAGLVETRRGRGGGAVLARPAEEITIGQVVRALETGEPLVACFPGGSGRCTLTERCKARHHLMRAEAAFLRELDGVKLADCAIGAAEAPVF